MKLAALVRLALGLSLAAIPAAATAATVTAATFPERATLYDAALGTTPDAQGMLFTTFPFDGAAATQSFTDGATLLDSTAAIEEFAGYIARPGQVPALDRTAGYSVFATLELLEERHNESEGDHNGDGVSDRAGLSLTVLGADLRGIELAFWEDEVWAQADGSGNSEDLFTHAEGAPFDPTAGLVQYELRVRGEEYTLLADGEPLLSGPLRDYSSFSGPFGPVYRTPNLVFLGDNSGNGSGRVRVTSVSVATGGYALALPLTTR
jgi:hypothetical protein